MRVESFPYNYPMEKDFPERRLLSSFEGGSLWLAEKDGRYYVIADEGTMADFLIPGEDDDLLNELVNIYEFDSELERQEYILERGWNERKP
jgi:hypothetical protein